MAITRNNPQSNTSTSSSGDTRTLSYTVSNVDNRVLVAMCGVHRNALTAFTVSATWNGNAMTSAVTHTTTGSSPNNAWRTYIFYYIAPSVTTADIVFTSSLSTNRWVVGAVTLGGVKQSSPVGITATDLTNPANSLTLNGCTAESLIIAAVTSNSGGTPTWSWTTATEDYDLNNGDSTSEAAGSAAYYTVTTAGNVTITATRSASSNGQVGVAAEFLAIPGSFRLVNPASRLTTLVGGTLA